MKEAMNGKAPPRIEVGMSFGSLEERIDHILQHPMSVDDYAERVFAFRKTTRGVASFSSREEFELALGYVASLLPVSEEWVARNLQHEDEHLEKARMIFESRGLYLYTIQAIDEGKNVTGVSCGFLVLVRDATQEELRNQSLAILKAPTEVSPTDKRAIEMLADHKY